jgi:altronate dehydratase
MAEFKLFMGEDGIMRGAFVGCIEEKDVIAAPDELVKIVNEIKERRKQLLLDLTKTTSATMKARKMFVEIAKSGILDKVAAVSSSIYVAVLSLFVIRAGGKVMLSKCSKMRGKPWNG